MIATASVAVALGVAIGLSLGALGGGGSILTVPALVYALGVSPRNATGSSLVIVGLSALIGMAGHHRAGRVRWGAGLSIGAISVVGSVIGTALNRRVNPDLLLALFAALMFVVAALMIRRDRRAGAPASVPGPISGDVELARGSSSVALATISAPPTTRTSAKPWLVGVVGVGVGFLTGFLGVGGGFIIVPSLVLALGFGLADAVGTSLLIIAMSSALALAERHGVSGVSWSVLGSFSVSAMVAALAGNQIASRVPARRLNQGFIVLVIAVACYVAIRSGVALTAA